jgi:hypothetical protein
MGILRIALFLISQMPLVEKDPTHFVKRIPLSIPGTGFESCVFAWCD